MKKTLSLMQIIGFLFTGILGVILHFLFDWTNQNILVAPFSAINESIWEHMKLLFFSMFFYALIENKLIGSRYNNFWCAKLFGISLGILLIPTLYYTYTGILGTSADWFNITIYYITSFISYYVETTILRNKNICYISPHISIIILLTIAVTFTIFTFIQPHIPLFQDPVTKLYGFGNI